jgi:mRNA interferase RelE/StbE
VKYEVELSREARKAFLALPKRDRRLVGRRLRDLAENPRPHGVKAFTKALKGYYRVRAGAHRIVYAVQDDQSPVLVVRIGPRHSVHEDAERAR